MDGSEDVDGETATVLVEVGEVMRAGAPARRSRSELEAVMDDWEAGSEREWDGADMLSEECAAPSELGGRGCSVERWIV